VDVISVVIDCEEPARLAEFWRGVVGGVINDRTRSAEWVAIEGVPGLAYLAFQRVPEPKLVKNRVHLDISAGDLESARQKAIGQGAVAVGSVVEEQTNRFQVMHDPEGNEFCFVMQRD
jgi:hypothetical protein